MAKKEQSFIEYFENEWIKLNPNWFEGIRHHTPSTNNALESFNKVIKDEETIRERLPLSRFRVIIMQSIEKWSKEYPRQLKFFVARPSITLELWTKSYQWAKSNKQTIEETDDNVTMYYAASGKTEKFSITDVETIKNMRYNTYDQFKRRCFSVWFVQIPNAKEKWHEGKCNCPAFFKHFVCKHLVGLAI